MTNKEAFIFPTSFAQQRLWFLDQLDPGQPVYNIPWAIQIDGVLRAEILCRTLQAIVDRHEILRTTFVGADGNPMQLVVEQQPVQIATIDLTHQPRAGRELEARRLAAEQARQPFDLASGPLLRITLLRLDAEEHLLLLMAHHMIFDAWSREVFFKELATLYAAFAMGLPAPLAPLPIQYADFAHWQRQWLQGAVLEQQLAYWKRQLDGAPAILDLPTDRPRPPAPTFQGGQHALAFPKHLVEPLTSVGHQARATLFMTLLAAFKTLLYRYTGQAAIVVGTPVANRRRAETADLIGFFTNMLPLRTDLSGDISFRTLLGRVREAALGAYDHQDLPFEKLVEELRPERDLNHTPLFQVAFSLQSAATGTLRLPGLVARITEVESGTAKFDLTLNLAETPEGPAGLLVYSSALFEAATIARMAGHLQTLLAGIAADPDRPIGELPLLTAEEQAQVLHEWNDTSTAYPWDVSVPHLFEMQVARVPHDVAIVMGDTTLSYRQLNARANQLAHYLRGLGVGPEVRVGISMERSFDVVIGYLGILKAGGAYVPLDPAYPDERLAYMLEDSRAAVLLTATNNPPDKVTRRQGDKVMGAAEEVTLSRLHSVTLSGMPVVDLIADWPVIAREPDTNPAVALHPDNLAYVIYTSGSTGLPKGICISHRAINRLVFNTNYIRITPDDRVGMVANTSFDAATFEVWGALLHGARLVVGMRDVVLAPQAFAAFIREQQISTIFLTTALFNQLVQEAPSAFASMRYVLTGGEAADPRWFAEVLRHDPPRRLLHVYGPTESTTYASWYEVLEVPAEATTIPIGRPVSNTTMYLLDARLQPVPVGVPGELYIGGDGLARAYLDRPELTAERFIPNPFHLEDRGWRMEDSPPDVPEMLSSLLDSRSSWDQETKLARNTLDTDHERSSILNPPSSSRLYRTGDLARYRPDGSIEFLGRIDAQIKLRGFRIELGEIEAVLAQHPAVRESVVLLREDVPGDRRLVAYFTPTTDDRRLTTDDEHEDDPAVVGGQSSVVGELLAFLRERLPEYMLPTVFVPLDALPITPNGKIDRRALPVPVRSEPEDGYVAPSTPIEQTLVDIWTQVLDIPQEDDQPPIGLHDNFFMLGGHSLLATRIMSRVRDALGIDLPLRCLFEAPTVAGLAEAITQANQPAQSSVAGALLPTARDAAVPLSFAQQRLWFLNRMEPDSPFYNVPMALRISGPLDRAALEQSLGALVQRHEILRTVFMFVDGQPVQQVIPAPSFHLPVQDLRAFGPGERQEQVQALIRQEGCRPFDLAHGPLLRAGLLRLDSTEYVLLLTMHHIVSDGWSLGVLFRELASHYTAFTTGQPVALAPLPIQYADFAQWQRTWLQGATLEQHLAYWKQQLAGASGTLALPTDRPRPALQSYHGAQQQVRFSRQLSDALKALAHAEGATLFMALLTAFKTLLYRYTDQTDLLIGTPIANRNRSDIEGLIGCFVNTLVLRTDLSGNPTFRDLLARVRETALEAYAHQDLPFEKLVEELQPTRDLSRNPLFQVMFNLQDVQMLTWDIAPLTMRILPVDVGVAQFDLSLVLLEHEQGTLGYCEYNTDLFDNATIVRMLEHLRTLLQAIVSAPDQPIACLPLLSEAEQQALLGGWQGPVVADLPYGCVQHGFEAQVERDPNAIALVFEGTRLTYAELNGRANQLARYLQRLGVGPDVRVAVCLDRSPELVVALLAVLKAGGAYIPLDPSYPAERQAFVLADAQVHLLIAPTTDDRRPTTEDRGLKIEDSGPEADHERSSILYPPSSSESVVRGRWSVVDLDRDWHLIAQERADIPESGVTPEHLAYVIYTSGSTGVPKGVAVRHVSVVNLLQSMAASLEISPADVLLAVTTISFDIAALELFLPLCTGGQVALAPRAAMADGPALAGLLRTTGATLLQATPTTYHLLLDTAPAAFTSPRLRALLCGGEALPGALAAALLAYPPALWNVYGPTETTIWSSAARLTTRGQMIPLGQPLANTQLYILDRHGHPVPQGVPGELYIGGAGLARGYLGRPDLTAERFVPNPFSPTTDDRRLTTDSNDKVTRRQGDKVTESEDAITVSPLHPVTVSEASVVSGQWSVVGGRLYRTGDLVRCRPDGALEFMGRIDAQIKLRGVRIELSEIEAVLSRHPAVRIPVVIVREDRPGERRLVAYIVPTTDDRRPTTDLRDQMTRRQGDEVTESLERITMSPLHPVTVSGPSVVGGPSSVVSELRSFLRDRLPESMIPAAFVFLEALPLLPNGKVNRGALPAPDGARPQIEVAYVAPETPLEHTIAGIWQSLLGVNTVGLYDNFFDLGGHSLLMVQVQSQLRERLNKDVPLIEMFRYHTIKDFAKYLGQGLPEPPAFEAPQARARIRGAALDEQRDLRQKGRASRKQRGVADE